MQQFVCRGVCYGAAEPEDIGRRGEGGANLKEVSQDGGRAPPEVRPHLRLPCSGPALPGVGSQHLVSSQLPLPSSCVTLGRFLDVSKPPFVHIPQGFGKD